MDPAGCGEGFDDLWAIGLIWRGGESDNGGCEEAHVV